MIISYRKQTKNRWLRSLIYLPIILITIFSFIPPKPVLADKTVCGTPGRDGPAVISAIINSYYPGSASTSPSATSITLGALDARGSSTTISAGSLLLVIQIQGADINTSNDMRYGAGLGTAGNQSSPGSGNLNTNFSAGQYEYVIASNAVGAGGGTLNITSSLVNTYYNANYGTQGQRRFQVIRVPQYSSASLGGTLTAPAWNGATGGMVILDVAGSFNLNGNTIDVTGLGFRGGAGIQMGGDPSAALNNLDLRTVAPGTIPDQTTFGGGTAPAPGASGSNQTNAAKGEGIAGTPRYVNVITASGYPSLNNTTLEGYPSGSMGRGAPGNAGGGGTDGGPATNEFNSGGGGGGNGGAGGSGGNSYNRNVADGGWGGSVFGAEGSSTVSPTRLTMGGGGGAGTNNNGTYSYYNGTTVQDDPQTGNNALTLLGFNPVLLSSGQPGGGIVMVRAGTVNGAGTINAKGKSAYRVTTSPNANSPYEVNWDGGGGGGAGGSVVVITQNASTPTLTINAQGGDGGNTNHQRAGTPPPHGPGGGGGGGVVYTSFSIANAANAVNGGVHGLSGNSSPWDSQFNAQSGSSGVLDQTRSPGNFSNSISGSTCIPDVSTTKTTSTPIVTQTITGTTGTYTINVSNVAGKGTAIGFTISDLLPTGFTYESTTSINLSGGATRPSTVDPTGGSGNPAWSVFDIPGGGQVQITFVVHIAAGTIGTFQNPATATYSDPTRITSDGTTLKGYDPASSANEDIHVLGYLTTTTAIHDSGHNIGTSSVVGTTVHDSVTVTGSGATPTGTVTFSYFTNGTCSAPAAGTSSAFTLIGGAVDGTTFTQTPAAVGSYSYQATYSGDANYLSGTSPCELLTVGKASPSITTTASPASGTVGIAVTPGDNATITGYNPTGSVTFTLYSDGACTTSVMSGSGTISGGAASWAPSSPWTPTAVGTWHWKASYAGDGNNNGFTTTCGTSGPANEQIVIGKASPSIGTTPGAGGTIGVTLTDTATLTGGNSPTGSVTFNLFSPTDATCSGAAAYTFTDGSAPYAAPGFVSNAVGTWHWTADYAGDANNNATSSACADETAVVTTASPSIGTTLSSSSILVGGTVHDSAVLTGATADAGGSVTYTAYTNNTCTLGARDGGTVTVAAGVVPDSNSLTFNAAGDYYWQAVYSGDGNNDGATSLCSSEHLVVGKIDPTVTTAIYNETTEQADVLVINIGDSVYDIATVTSTSTIPITGTVDFLFYSTIDCTGSSTLAGVDVALTGEVATSTTQLPLIVGAYSFRAHYSGDSNFNSADSACEPLTVNLEGLFDPPFGIKTVNAQGLPVLTWTMVWINNANHVPIAAAVHDPIPNGSTYVAGSLTCTPSGTSTTSICVFEAPSVTFPRGRIVWSGVIVNDFGATTALTAANEVTIMYSVTVSSSVNSVRNIATIDSDLNGNGTTDDPGEQNVFSASARWARFGGPSIPGTGFAPGRLTFLPIRVVDYKGLGDLTLEVPSLGVNIPIIGVPQESDKAWDVSWLGGDAGWLAGSAFPTWNGNSVLTAHVYDANGKPGPFINLNKLKWGDQIIVHAWGQQYTYEVREVIQVNPGDIETMMKHQASPWLTLVTCRGYDETLDTYLYRVLVRAVLVNVK